MPALLQSFLYALSAFVLLVGALLLKRNTRTLKDLRGPPSRSFWLGATLLIFTITFVWLTAEEGNLLDIRYENEVGNVEFPWMREFGGAWKIKGILGVGSDVLTSHCAHVRL